jgi:ribose-phosphate pyrophosphokinase
MNTDRPKLMFATTTYAYVEDAYLEAGTFDRGRVEQKIFPDGEIYRRIVDDVWGRDVVLLGGTPRDADWLEVYDLGCGISRAGARSLSIVMPYFGYSTMERAVKSGEVVTAKTRARLISAIPPCEGGTRTFLFDLHTDGIEFYFSDSHVTHHIYGSPLITETIESLAAGRPYVLGATDAGRAKWVESLARRLQCSPAFVYKRRDASTGKLVVTGVNADVNDKVVVIYDDMIRTGSSLIQAAQAYRDAGASEVHAVASHLVLPGDALDRILGSGMIKSVNGTDSHPASQAVAERGGLISSIAGLLCTEIARS